MFKIFFKRTKCLLCDFGIVWLLYYCFSYVIPFKTPFIGTFFCFVGLYFLITCIFIRKSIFQYLFHFEIERNAFRYTLFKILFLSIIPFFLTFRVEYSGLPTIIVFLLLTNLISFAFKKKSIWELCAKTELNSLQKGKHNNLFAKII